MMKCALLVGAAICLHSVILCYGYQVSFRKIYGPYSREKVIRPLPCTSPPDGIGVCMFSYDCMQAKGTPIGVCTDSIYVGSCCRLQHTPPPPVVIVSDNIVHITSSVASGIVASNTIVRASTKSPITRISTQSSIRVSSTLPTTRRASFTVPSTTPTSTTSTTTSTTTTSTTTTEAPTTSTSSANISESTTSSSTTAIVIEDHFSTSDSLPLKNLTIWEHPLEEAIAQPLISVTNATERPTTTTEAIATRLAAVSTVSEAPVNVTKETTLSTVVTAEPTTPSTLSSTTSTTPALSTTNASTKAELPTTASTPRSAPNTTEAPSTTTTSAPSTTVSTTTTTAAPTKPPGLNEICGRKTPVAKGRIVGGTQSTFSEWPWMVSLRQWKKSAFLHKCGAALLNNFWAVTAAHCVENVAPNDLLLRLGEFDVSHENEPYPYIERRVQLIAPHPEFDPRTFEYDLALLRFYEPVHYRKNIVPICIPQGNDSYIGKRATVTGWGRLYEDGPLPDVLQHVEVPVITNRDCETMYRRAGYIEDIPNIFICAGMSKGGKDSCEGDSGGPLVIEQEDKWQLIGIISWGIGCALPNQPGVYTRISEFAAWINQIVAF